MGMTALDWADVESFSNQSAYILDGWQSEQIILMSRAYCRMAHESKELGFPAPYNQAASNEDALQKNRDKVNSQFMAMRRKHK
jgi:hypothetical protein